MFPSDLYDFFDATGKNATNLVSWPEPAGYSAQYGQICAERVVRASHI
jgi:hypothetical protein